MDRNELRGKDAPGTPPVQRWTLWPVVLVLALVLLAHEWWSQGRGVTPVAWSEFEQQLKAGAIDEVTVGDRRVTGHLKSPRADGTKLVVATPMEPAMADRLGAAGVRYERVHEPTWLQDLLSWVLPALVFMGVWNLMAGRMANRMGMGSGMGMGGLLGIGRSKARLNVDRNTGVRFDDVAGVDEAKAELQEVVEFLKDPKALGRLGARIPKGVLLVGPTGTGKTLLARAVAGEAGVAFFSISGSEFIEMFVGVGAARVRDLFEQARQNAPAIIFIDELDALGRTRGAAAFGGGHDEREQTLDQLLVELDGFDPAVGVVLLAATNRPEILDPALLRAGRFDRQVLVDRPDRAGRLAILKVHARRVTLAPGTDLEPVAAITVGLAGADLANLVNEAALVATRRGADGVSAPDFTRALERLVAGIEKKHFLLDARERTLVATHEMGHALIALALPGTDRVHKVSIVPRGIGALGYTMQRPSEDRHVMRRGELVDRLTVLLGGRAAEMLAFGEASTGAADDLARATDLARDMVTRQGMDDAIGPVVLAGTPSLFLGPAGDAPTSMPAGMGPRTAERVDAAVRALLDSALARGIELLRARRAALDRCVEALLARETLEEAELVALGADDRVSHGAAPPPATPAAP
jgi:cell division protease FtsH